MQVAMTHKIENNYGQTWTLIVICISTSRKLSLQERLTKYGIKSGLRGTQIMTFMLTQEETS